MRRFFQAGFPRRQTHMPNFFERICAHSCVHLWIHSIYVSSLAPRASFWLPSRFSERWHYWGWLPTARELAPRLLCWFASSASSQNATSLVCVMWQTRARTHAYFDVCVHFLRLYVRIGSQYLQAVQNKFEGRMRKYLFAQSNELKQLMLMICVVIKTLIFCIAYPCFCTFVTFVCVYVLTCVVREWIICV